MERTDARRIEWYYNSALAHEMQMLSLSHPRHLRNMLRLWRDGQPFCRMIAAAVLPLARLLKIFLTSITLTPWRPPPSKSPTQKSTHSPQHSWKILQLVFQHRSVAIAAF